MKKLSMALAVLLCSMLLFTGCDAASVTGGLINFENIADNLEGIGELLESIGDMASLFEELSNSNAEDLLETKPVIDGEESWESSIHTETARPDRPIRPDDTQTDVEATERPVFDADAPSLSGGNYDGRELHILASSDNNGWVTMDEGSIVNASVYSRNMMIEEQLNVSMVYSFVEEASAAEKGFQNHVLNQYIAGLPIDIVIGRTSSLQTLAQQGALGDWNRTDVDIDREWWYQDAKDQFTTAGGRLYSLAGDGSHAILENTLVTFFNTNILECYNVYVDGFYSAVESGEWTYDLLYSYTKDMYVDLDCNAEINTNDMFGYCVSNIAAYAAVASAGEHMLVKNSGSWGMNGLWTESVINVADFVTNRYDLFGAYNDVPKTMFVEERLVFMTEHLSFARTLEECGINFGILPTPAYGRNDYSSVVMSNAPVIGYCSNIESVELVSDVADLMGYYGNKATLSAYLYKTAQSSRDYDMLEIIRSSLYFDHEFLIGSSNLYTRVVNLIAKGDNNIAPEVASYKAKIVAEVQEWSSALDSLPQ